MLTFSVEPICTSSACMEVHRVIFPRKLRRRRGLVVPLHPIPKLLLGAVIAFPKDQKLFSPLLFNATPHPRSPVSLNKETLPTSFPPAVVNRSSKLFSWRYILKRFVISLQQFILVMLNVYFRSFLSACGFVFPTSKCFSCLVFSLIIFTLLSWVPFFQKLDHQTPLLPGKENIFQSINKIPTFCKNK